MTRPSGDPKGDPGVAHDAQGDTRAELDGRSWNQRGTQGPGGEIDPRGHHGNGK